MTVGLLKALHQRNLSTLGIKPIASGGQQIKGQVFNEDALALQQASSVQLDYRYINPFSFQAPIAPHIAAANTSTVLTVADITTQLDYAVNYPCDAIIIEGAGGWLVPLNKNETMADIAVHYQCGVILVVGIRLGCINHSFLTYQAIQQTKLSVLGWVANCIDPETLEKNAVIETIKARLNIPLLGIVPFGAEAQNYLTIEETL